MSEAYREIFDVNTGEVRREPVPAEIRRKSWVFKMWEQMTDEDKNFLRAHFDTFEKTAAGQEKLLAYKKYLHHWVGVPCNWLEIVDN